MAGVRGRLSESGDAFRRVFGNRDLRRLQFAFVGSVLGQWSYVVALAVYAYDEGGAGLVGITTLVRLLPGALAAPFVGALADRYSRRGVLIAGDLARAALLGVAALGAATDTLALVLVAVACASVAATAFEPGRAAMLPGLARTPEELTAANVTGSAIDGTGMFLGPALGGLLLVATSPGAVFGATVATLLWSAALVVGVREPERAPAEPAEAPARMLHAVSQGVAAIRADARVRTLVGLAAAQTLVAGALAVFTVVIAFRLLERGTAWVGYLEAAIGVGGLIGVVAAAGLVGRPRLTSAIITARASGRSHCCATPPARQPSPPATASSSGGSSATTSSPP